MRLKECGNVHILNEKRKKEREWLMLGNLQPRQVLNTRFHRKINLQQSQFHYFGGIEK